MQVTAHLAQKSPLPPSEKLMTQQHRLGKVDDFALLEGSRREKLDELYQHQTTIRQTSGFIAQLEQANKSLLKCCQNPNADN